MLDGIPVVDSYKYLGVWIDNKLSPKKHIDYLFGVKGNEEGLTAQRGKINFLVGTLGKCLQNVSFDYRANLWITFIRPLFLPLATLATILNNTEKEIIQTKLRISLRKFLGLPKNFSNDILCQIFPIDFCEWMEIESENNKMKWEARRMRTELECPRKYKVIIQRYIPSEFSKLLRCFTATCRVCKTPFYPAHLEEHGMRGVRIEEIFDGLDSIRQKLEGVQDLDNPKRKGRIADRDGLMEAYRIYIEDLQEGMDKILVEFAEKF